MTKTCKKKNRKLIKDYNIIWKISKSGSKIVGKNFDDLLTIFFIFPLNFHSNNIFIVIFLSFFCIILSLLSTPNFQHFFTILDVFSTFYPFSSIFFIFKVDYRIFLSSFSDFRSIFCIFHAFLSVLRNFLSIFTRFTIFFHDLW